MIYFSGHGLISSAGGYVGTADYKKYDEDLLMHDILAIANQSKANDKVVLLGCCHFGVFGTPTVIDRNVSQLAEGLSVLTASRDSESDMEINGSGAFT